MAINRKKLAKLFSVLLLRSCFIDGAACVTQAKIPKACRMGYNKKCLEKGKPLNGTDLLWFGHRRQFVAFDVDSEWSSCLSRKRLTHHTDRTGQLTFTLKAVKDIKPLNEAPISTFNKKYLH
jgi:hypothetical protein